MSAAGTRPNLQIDADEDLDELDDVLSEFAQNTKSKGSQGIPPLSPLVSPPPPPPTATTTTAFGRPRTNTRVDSAPISVPGSGILPSGPADNVNEEAALSDEFTRELVQNMQDLMRELAEEGKVSEEEIVEKDDLAAQTEEESKQKESERLMKAAWEAMLIEGMNGMTEDPVSEASTSKGTNDFQSKIKQTMDKLKKSEDNMKTSSSSTGPGGPETLQGLLDSLKDLGLDDLGEGEEDEAELAGFLENMMGQLMGKEVLYEPLKELKDKFPDYLENPPTPLSAADKERYSKQYEYVQQILAIFEEPGYDENNQTTGAKVAELMGEMQNYGAPPESIMGPMPPMPDGGCVVS